MKGLLNRTLSVVVLTAVAGGALAAGSAESQGGSLLMMLFIGFFALIVVFQLVPACLLFWGMVKGLFSRQREGKEKRSRV